MAHILVVDDDPLVIKLVEKKLADAGYSVHTAEDGQKALQYLSSVHIDLVITDVVMPILDGWAFIRELRMRPEYAFLPVIFLTALDSADDRIKGFNLGADDYLAKPFKAEELLLRAQRTLRNAESLYRATQDSFEQPSGFEGSLEQVGISSLLVLLENERKTGELIVNRKDLKGTLQFREGRILNANLSGADVPTDSKSGSESIYYLLRWSDGRFNFSPKTIEAEDAIRTPTTALLMEGARRLDEAARP